MSLGSVVINTLDKNQSPPDSIERLYCFVGTPGPDFSFPDGVIFVLGINSDSDFTMLGFEDSPVKTAVQAAMNNGGQHWNAYVALGSANTFNNLDALEKIMQNHSVEGFVFCDPVSTSDKINQLQTFAVSLLNSSTRRVHVLAAAPDLNAGENWTNYTDRLTMLTINLFADRVAMVAPLYPEFLGALAGRLCNKSVTVADSPMRTATGTLVGDFSNYPADGDGMTLNKGHLQRLHDDGRYCVPQWYEDYPGMYTSDAVMLTNETSDYKLLEHLRVADKAARQIYQMLVPVIANRQLNRRSTPAYATKFEKPLIAMSHSTTIGGEVLPGEVKKPQKGDIVIDWPTRESIVVYFTIRPYNAPKAITGNILLDLSNGEPA